MGQRWRFSSALLALLLVCFFSPATQAQSSLPSSPALEPVWQTLLRATSDLPTLMDAYEANWMRQIESLKASVEQSQTSIDSLEKQNEDLVNSLIRSRADLAISEQEQARSEKLLQDSIKHITQAQAAAKVLEVENAVLKYSLIGAAAVAVVAVVVAIIK
jgi:septal ring factor EnvC (AmiA/AmiB activator)